MTRTEQATALAKVAAYIACGRPSLGAPFAQALLAFWRSAGVL